MATYTPRPTSDPQALFYNLTTLQHTAHTIHLTQTNKQLIITQWQKPNQLGKNTFSPQVNHYLYFLSLALSFRGDLWPPFNPLFPGHPPPPRTAQLRSHFPALIS